MARDIKAREFEVALEQPAWLVWQAHVKNFQISLPAAVQGHFKAVEYLDGPPLAPGGVFKITYEEGFGHYDSVTFRWDQIDHEKFYFKVTTIDGGALGKHFDHLVYYYEVVQGPSERSSILKWKFDYHDCVEHDFHNVLQDELTMLSTGLHDHIETLKNK